MMFITSRHANPECARTYYITFLESQFQNIAKIPSYSSSNQASAKQNVSSYICSGLYRDRTHNMKCLLACWTAIVVALRQKLVDLYAMCPIAPANIRTTNTTSLTGVRRYSPDVSLNKLMFSQGLWAY